MSDLEQDDEIDTRRRGNEKTLEPAAKAFHIEVQSLLRHVFLLATRFDTFFAFNSQSLWLAERCPQAPYLLTPVC